jgi:hypothetical protein
MPTSFMIPVPSAAPLVEALNAITRGLLSSIGADILLDAY